MESICCPWQNSWQKARISCCKCCRCREFSSWMCLLPTSFIFCISCVVVGFLLVSLVGEKCFDQKNSSFGRWFQVTKLSTFIFGRWIQATKLCVCSRTFAPDPVQRKTLLVSLIFEHNFDCRQFSWISVRWRIFLYQCSLKNFCPEQNWSFDFDCRRDNVLVSVFAEEFSYISAMKCFRKTIIQQALQW